MPPLVLTKYEVYILKSSLICLDVLVSCQKGTLFVSSTTDIKHTITTLNTHVQAETATNREHHRETGYRWNREGFSPS